MERSCELCRRSPARMFCDSDEARLCWDCDEKVHGANFLVAKHSRTLLCNACQSLTPWKASGTKLSHTISVCEGCFENCNNPADAGSSGMARIREPPRGEEEDGGDDTGVDDGDDEDSDSSSESLENGEEEEDGENQVVPWASYCPSPSVSSAAPPLATSSSESLSSRNDALKRSWSNRISDSEDEDASCSSQGNSIMAVSVNPAKRRQADGGDGGGGGRDDDHSESVIIRRTSELSDAA